MADYFFFLSYARLDRTNDPDRVIMKFYEQLTSDVRALTNADPQSVAFFDSEDIEPGDTWPQKIAEALTRCRVFVPILSPTYFDRPYCGKEWGVFRERVLAYAPGAAAPPPLIQPVLLVPRMNLRNIPPVSSDLQDDYEKYPQDYRELGLRQLVRLQNRADAFKEFTWQLAQRIVKVATDHPLPPLANLVDIKQAPSVFTLPAPLLPGAPPPAPPPEDAGPKYAQFFFIAGRKQEMAQVRQSSDAYGEGGPEDWKPYHPDVPEDISLLAQGIARDEKLRSELIPLDALTIQRLQEAERKQKVAIIVLDSWALKLPAYRELMRQYDAVNLYNCALVIPWNERDPETAQNRGALEQNIRLTFVRKTHPKDPNSFRDQSNSPEKFKEDLANALAQVRARIIEIAGDFRAAEGPERIPQPVVSVAGAGRTP